MEERNVAVKKIFVYFLVVFFAVFIGTSIFLVLNSKKPQLAKETITTTATVPTVIPTQGSFNLELSGNEKISLPTGKEVNIDLIADSNQKNIVGYDLVLSYDPLAFDFVKATSNLPNFKIYSYKKDSYLSFLATKNLQSQTSAVFTQTKIASLSFKPLKAGRYSFTLKPLMGQDKTDLVTDKTEVLNPKLNKLEVEVF